MLQHGIRWEADPQTLYSEMPAFGRDGLLTSEEIADVAAYVLTLSGGDVDEGAAARGEEVYLSQCAFCHGERGEGMTEVGAPALNDQIWLYGGTRADIVRQLNEPRHGVMPAWSSRLDDITIKQLTVYVHSLGGGQ